MYNEEYFSEDEVRLYIAEIILAIEQLHKLDIVYRDIKLENILFDSEGHIVVTDFGLSKILTENTNYRSYSFCGTLEYMAPEMVRGLVRGGSKGHSFAVDWWSIGVICFEMLTGTSPFSLEDSEANSKSDVSKRIQFSNPPIPKDIGADARDLITRLLCKDPARRLGSRRGAIDIKAHRFFNGIDWERLANKDFEMPFKPFIKDELDTRNFDDDFTMLPVEVEEPSAPLAEHEYLIKGKNLILIIFISNY